MANITKDDLGKLQKIVAKALRDKGTRDDILNNKRLPPGMDKPSDAAIAALFALTPESWDSLSSSYQTLISGGARPEDVLGMIF